MVGNSPYWRAHFAKGIRERISNTGGRIRSLLYRLDDHRLDAPTRKQLAGNLSSLFRKRSRMVEENPPSLLQRMRESSARLPGHAEQGAKQGGEERQRAST